MTVIENPDELGYFTEDATYEICSRCCGDGVVFIGEPQPCLACWGTGYVVHNCSNEQGAIQ